MSQIPLAEFGFLYAYNIQQAIVKNMATSKVTKIPTKTFLIPSDSLGFMELIYILVFIITVI
jgi:hypothetical protein